MVVAWPAALELEVGTSENPVEPATAVSPGVDGVGCPVVLPVVVGTPDSITVVGPAGPD